MSLSRASGALRPPPAGRGGASAAKNPPQRPQQHPTLKPPMRIHIENKKKSIDTVKTGGERISRE